MPPKETLLKNDLFVMDGAGKCRKIASEVSVVSSIEDDCMNTARIEINALREFGLTVDSEVINAALLKLISYSRNYKNNNWRKMHGIPMIRHLKARNAGGKRQ